MTFGEGLLVIIAACVVAPLITIICATYAVVRALAAFASGE